MKKFFKALILLLVIGAAFFAGNYFKVSNDSGKLNGVASVEAEVPPALINQVMDVSDIHGILYYKPRIGTGPLDGRLYLYDMRAKKTNEIGRIEREADAYANKYFYYQFLTEAAGESSLFRYSLVTQKYEQVLIPGFESLMAASRQDVRKTWVFEDKVLYHKEGGKGSPWNLYEYSLKDGTSRLVKEIPVDDQEYSALEYGDPEMIKYDEGEDVIYFKSGGPYADYFAFDLTNGNVMTLEQEEGQKIEENENVICGGVNVKDFFADNEGVFIDCI